MQYEWTAEQLLEEVKRYWNFIRKGGVTLTGGEPLVQAQFVAEFFSMCHEAGLHTCLDTSGSVWNDNVRQALQHTDLVMLDIKAYDDLDGNPNLNEDSLHVRLTGQPRTNNQAMLDYLEEQGIPTWIRHVVVPTLTDNDERLHALAEHVSHYQCVQKVEILPYHTMGRYKYEDLGLAYPLEGIEPLSAERKQNAISIFRQHVSCEVVG